MWIRDRAEAEGIFLWAFEGLQRLVANNFKFTESDRIRENREAVKRDNNNIFDFMDSEGYIPVSYTHLDVYKRQDEDGEETGEDVALDDSWNYTDRCV